MKTGMGIPFQPGPSKYKLRQMPLKLDGGSHVYNQWETNLEILGHNNVAGSVKYTRAVQNLTDRVSTVVYIMHFVVPA